MWEGKSSQEGSGLIQEEVDAGKGDEEDKARLMRQNEEEMQEEDEELNEFRSGLQLYEVGGS